MICGSERTKNSIVCSVYTISLDLKAKGVLYRLGSRRNNCTKISFVCHTYNKYRNIIAFLLVRPSLLYNWLNGPSMWKIKLMFSLGAFAIQSLTENPVVSVAVSFRHKFQARFPRGRPTATAAIVPTAR